MKERLNKLASSAAGLAIFLIGCLLAGLGLWLVFVLALFALAVIGLGLLASPLVALAQGKATHRETEQPAA